MRLANDKYTSKKSKTSRTPEPNPAFAEMVCWDFNDIFGKKFLIMHYSSHLSCSRRIIITSPKQNCHLLPLVVQRIQKSIENVVKNVWQMIRPLSKTHKMKTLCQYLRLAEISWCDFHDILEVILPGPYKSTITSSIFNAESSHQPLIQLHYFIDT